MAICQIAFITKAPRLDPYHAISEVGGPAPDGYGSIWRCSLQEAVNAALYKGVSFYTMVDGYRTPVEVATGPSGAHYLRTVPDSTRLNNLLSLPGFPPTSLLGRPVYTEPAGFVPASLRGGLLHI